MDRRRLDTFLERGIRWLVLSILVLAPLMTGAVRSLEFLILQGLACGVVLLWLPRFFTREGHRLLLPPVGWAALLFVGYAIFRYAGADLDYVATSEFSRVLVYAVLFFAVLDNLHRQEQVHRILYALVFLAMLIALYAVFQFVTGSDRVWHFVKPGLYEHRASGTFISPNSFAGYLELLLPVSLAMTVVGRLDAIWKIFFAYASVAIVTGIGISLSRGGWFATALAVGLFSLMVFRDRARRIAAVVAVVLIAAGGVFFWKNAQSPQQRLARMFKDGKIDDVRFEVWKPAWAMWKDHPWTGVGPGHFDYRFRSYRPEDIQMRPERVHNDYLNALVDWGVAGASLVALALALAFWGAIRTWRYVERSSGLSSKPSNRSAVVLGLTLGLFSVLAHTFVDFHMHIPAIAVTFATFLALLSSYHRYATERFWFQLGAVGKGFAVAMLVACLGFLTVSGWRRLQEWRYLSQAAQSTSDRPSAVAALERAFAVAPANFDTAYALGENHRLESWTGRSGWRADAEKAIEWYERAMELNPYDPYAPMRLGMTLDWLDRSTEAEDYFDRALELDPRNYFILAHYGWHKFQRGEYEAAREWLMKSMSLSHWHPAHVDEASAAKIDHLARTYLALIERRLSEEEAMSEVQRRLRTRE